MRPTAEVQIQWDLSTHGRSKVWRRETCDGCEGRCPVPALEKQSASRNHETREQTKRSPQRALMTLKEFGSGFALHGRGLPPSGGCGPKRQRGPPFHITTMFGVREQNPLVSHSTSIDAARSSSELAQARPEPSDFRPLAHRGFPCISEGRNGEVCRRGSAKSKAEHGNRHVRF